MASVGDRVACGIPRVKIEVPRVPHRYLPRERLITDLDRADPGQLTLVSAPAGYGKTLMLAEWAARSPHRTAWVSLDDDDNDDRHFWSAVLSALVACPALHAANVLHELEVPAGPSADPAFLAAVTNGLAGAGAPIHLILDDVHELIAAAPRHGLAALVRHRPLGLHLVLSGRADPPLALARMRLSGELHEIRARHLRFCTAEAGAMLAAAGVSARPDQVDLLIEQTEGWPAGLRLAALALRDTHDPDRFLADFVANDRAVAEYLVGEILIRLPSEVHDLLRAVSICEQLPADLAVCLSGRPDAGEVLDMLERETALVSSVGGGRAWYRVQPLLRAYLRADLRRRRPDLAAQLHGRAVEWFTGRDQPLAALEHAIQTEEHDRVAKGLRRHAVRLLARGDGAAVRKTLKWLGPARVAGDPYACLIAALLAVDAGAIAAADTHLAHGEQCLPADRPADLVALRGLVRARRAGLLDGENAAPQIAAELDIVAEHEPDLVPIGLPDLAFALLAQGEREDARRLGTTILDTAEQQDRRDLTARGLTVLAAIAEADGDYRRMSELADRADRQLPRPAWQDTATAAICAILRACAATLRAEPRACLEQVAPAAVFADRPGTDLWIWPVPLALAYRGAALFDLGRRAEGLEDLRRAQSAAAQRHAGPGQNATIAVLAHSAATLTGRHQLARTILTWAESVLGASGEVAMMRARQQILRGRHAAAVELLDPLLDGSQPALLPWVLVEGQVLACRLALHADRRLLARLALDRALELAAETDVLRPIVLSPPEVLDLLIRNLGSFGRGEPAAARALALRESLRSAEDPVALTERERAVLRLLPTQRSLHEIAEDLTVSHSTVKTHVRAIYGKLGVSSRRDAIAAARRHGVPFSERSETF